MSDEGDSMSEGFSASEDEWVPSKDLKGGESSDDDDSDFERSPLTDAASAGSSTRAARKRSEPKARSAVKQTSKKRSGLSLRSKLYNKYRPPPKTVPPSSSAIGKNSPTASTSRTISKNSTLPNESKKYKHKTNDDEESGTTSDSSIGNYLVNFEDLDIRSSFFNVVEKSSKTSSASPAPVFNCNAGIENLSDSASNDEKDEAKTDEKTFNFHNLLEYAKSMESLKKNVAKHNAEEANKKSSATKNIDSLDVYSVLALGEKQHNRSHNDGEDEDDEDDEGIGNDTQMNKNQIAKLNKTKSTRIKRHTKTRPSSTVAANDTDDSDWEEVQDSSRFTNNAATSNNISQIGNLEIHVDLPSHNLKKKTRSQQDVEMAFKRKLNRDIKERQVLLHKASLLCRFGRSIFYNRLLNNTLLMQKTLKLLPSKSAYPSERGTEMKYFHSMVTWFKSVIKLKSQNLYPEDSASKTKSKVLVELLTQIEDKEARCKQDMIFTFIILLRGMGLQCRLIVNMQPLPLRPAQSDMLTIKMRKDDEIKDQNIKRKESSLDLKTDTEVKASPSNKNITKKEVKAKEITNEVGKKSTKSLHKDQESSTKTSSLPDNSKETTKSSKVQSKCTVKEKKSVETKIDSEEKNNTVVKNLKQIKNPTEEYNEKTHPTLKATDSTPTNFSSHANEDSLNSAKKKNYKSEHVLSDEKSNDMELNFDGTEEQENSQKENKNVAKTKPSLARLKRANTKDNNEEPEGRTNKKPVIKAGSVVVPKVIIHTGNYKTATEQLPSCSSLTRSIRSRSKSPHAHISTDFLLHGTNYREKFLGVAQPNTNAANKTARAKTPPNKAKISTDFLTKPQPSNKRILRSRQKTNETEVEDSKSILMPQLDGANDTDDDVGNKKTLKSKNSKKKELNLKKLKAASLKNSDEDFEPSPAKKPKNAPSLSKKNRQVVSSEDENDKRDYTEGSKQKPTAGDMWIEVWCDVEEQWACVDIFKCKIHCFDTIRKSASLPMAYVFAFQNDLSIKDVTARYCLNWATVIRKSRIEKPWLDAAISKYLGGHTRRDIKEDEELRRIHEEKPMPTAISEYKNHPFYVLERHLLKFEALYPPDAPALGYVRGEPVYSRDCVHTLHSREIWLKQARTVKLGETPYKIVKARPKWDRITQTVIKDQPLEIFGFWQTQDYEPPTAENGLVPRNAYGNVELFKPSMLPKKTKHIQLPGLNRICKKLGIDCANAVVGFDFHQGACHPTFDGFVVCEEFEDLIIAAWHQDQEEQERKEREKYETRVYGNWKKLIRGLLIRERLKLKYNF